MLHRVRILSLSGTVEILFRRHTDAPRGCSKHLYPAGMQVTGYGRLPISGQSLHMTFLCVLCASVVNENVCQALTEYPNLQGGKQ
jgi:hypothetical protein